MHYLNSYQELPELWSLAMLLPAVVKKLSYSSSLDLVPLMEISGIKQVSKNLHNVDPVKLTIARIILLTRDFMLHVITFIPFSQTLVRSHYSKGCTRLVL